MGRRPMNVWREWKAIGARSVLLVWLAVGLTFAGAATAQPALAQVQAVVTAPTTWYRGQVVQLDIAVGFASSGTTAAGEFQYRFGVAIADMEVVSASCWYASISPTPAPLLDVMISYKLNLDNYGDSCHLTIKVTVADDAAPGVISLTEILSTGTPVTRIAPTMTVIPPPTISSISPSSGSAVGGTEVTINGANFVDGATEVSFGGVPATSVTVLSSTSVRVTTPPNPTGAAQIGVKVGSGTGTYNGFSYSKAAPAVNVTVSPSSSTAGEEVTVTAAVVGGYQPTGYVRFFDGATYRNIALSSNGEAALELTPRYATTYTFSAEYSGDANNSVQSGSTQHTVAPAATSTSLQSDLNPSTAGDAVTFTATVTPSAAGGYVDFYVDNGFVGSAVLASGSASYSLSTLPVGSSEITARYVSSDGVHNGSTSDPLTQTVEAQGTVTIRQVVDGVADGTFGFTSSTTALNVDVTTAGGEGESSAVALAAGSYSISAADMRDDGFVLLDISCSDGSVGNVATRSASIALTNGEDVVCTFTSTNTADTGISLTVTPVGSSSYGNTVTLSASIDGYQPTGTITFSDDSGSGWSETVNLVSGEAEYQISSLPARSYGFVANYSGDTYNDGVQSGSVEHEVVGLDVTLDFTVTPSGHSTYGDAITLSATVTGTQPTGTITFSDGGDISVVANLVDGKAETEVVDLPVGSYSFVATYSGDGANAGASETVAHEVDPVDASVALTVTPWASSTWGAPITLRASVTGSLPTGSVTFSDSGSSWSETVTLADGEAQYEFTNLPIGSYAFTASYSGDTNNSAAQSDAVDHEVAPIAASVAVDSSSTPAVLGSEVTFTATVTPSDATGEVEFFIDGGSVGTKSLSGGVASYGTDALTAGDHSVVAKYLGDETHTAATSSTLEQEVREPLGRITIRQVVSGGPDASFAFSSATTELNLAVATSGGSGASAPVSLAPGLYTLVAADMSADGYVLDAIACSDADSSGARASRTATVNLAADEAVTCTFTSRYSTAATEAMMRDFMALRGKLLLAAMPDMQRRVDRLNRMTRYAPGVGQLLGYVPRAVQSGTVELSTSLGAIEALGGRAEPSDLDIWIDGSYATVDGGASFGRLAVGADYVLGPDMLVGAFVQVDRMVDEADAAAISGTGWLAGPYLTMRLGEGVYLDLLAAAGTSTNAISPDGSYTDSFGATRWLASAALQGEWAVGDWSFSPRASIGYYAEQSEAYTDSHGAPIASQLVQQGEIAAGPGIGYSGEMGEIAYQLGLRLDAVAEIDETGISDPYGRVEASLALGLPGGASLSVSGSYDGLWSATDNSRSVSLSLSAPMW